MSLRASSALAWLAIALMCGCAWQPAAAPPSEYQSPPVILITIDALNCGHLPLYGYQRNTAPALARLSEQSLFYTRVWSTSSWTAPAMASLFSGLYPRTHSVLEGTLSLETAEVTGQQQLPGPVLTMAERLRQTGYETIGISSNPHLTQKAGFAQGFDFFYENEALRQAIAAGDKITGTVVTDLLLDAHEVNRIALRYLGVRDRQRPFFLWLHYLDPHWPYSGRLPWIIEYAGGQRIDLDRDTLDLGVPMDKVKELGMTGDDALSKYLIDCYDSELSAMDEQLGQLLDRIPEAESAVVIVTADHGEGLFEHGQLGHRITLYEEETRVPLLIRLPRERRTAKRMDDPASLIDILPTLLGALNLPGDPSLPGRNLLAPAGTSAHKQRLLAMELPPFIATVKGRWKYIHDSRDAMGAEAYDLESDPQERDNRAADQSLITLLTNDLRAWTESVPRGGQSIAGRIMAEEEIEELRALGYGQPGQPRSAADSRAGREGAPPPPISKRDAGTSASSAPEQPSAGGAARPAGPAVKGRN